jgi:branched-chain amino acid transport system ATP-binding protein
MCAIGRALMANPKMILLDEPSMGLAPQIVEEVFEHRQGSQQRENVTFLLAEQNTMHRAALCRFRLHPGERPGGDGGDAEGSAHQRGRQGVLPRPVIAGRKSFKDVKHYRRRKRWLS